GAGEPGTLRRSGQHLDNRDRREQWLLRSLRDLDQRGAVPSADGDVARAPVRLAAEEVLLEPLRDQRQVPAADRHLAIPGRPPVAYPAHGHIPHDFLGPLLTCSLSRRSGPCGQPWASVSARRPRRRASTANTSFSATLPRLTFAPKRRISQACCSFLG